MVKATQKSKTRGPGRRKKIPPDVEGSVLLASRRRCCVCYGLNRDLNFKKGQLAHLDQNPANRDEDNLAFICLDHHDWYDTKPSQSKRLTMFEVKQFRSELYAELRRLDADSAIALELIARGPPSTGAQGDHWAQRYQLELHVIANVASGREPAMFPLSGEPVNSRLRYLKDEIQGRRLVGSSGDAGPNADTQVSMTEFTAFAERIGQQDWVVQFAKRWKTGHGHQPERYLQDVDSEVTHALLMMVSRSAWGRWYRQQVGTSGENALTDGSTMHVAAYLITDAAMNGRLELRGRLPSEVNYEPIQKETWRLAALAVEPDSFTIWKVKVHPRHGVDPDRIKRVLVYDSLVVNSQAFEALWPGEIPTEKRGS
jgi:hypothetical protein